MKNLKAWMHRKGISLKDLVMVSAAFGFLLSVTVTFIWAGVQSLL